MLPQLPFNRAQQWVDEVMRSSALQEKPTHMLVVYNAVPECEGGQDKSEFFPIYFFKGGGVTKRMNSLLNHPRLHPVHAFDLTASLEDGYAAYARHRIK